MSSEDLFYIIKVVTLILIFTALGALLGWLAGIESCVVLP